MPGVGPVVDMAARLHDGDRRPRETEVVEHVTKGLTQNHSSSVEHESRKAT